MTVIKRLADLLVRRAHVSGPDAQALAHDIRKVYAAEDLAQLAPRPGHMLVHFLKNVGDDVGGNYPNRLGEIIRTTDPVPHWALVGCRVVYEASLAAWVSEDLAIVAEDAVLGHVPNETD